MKFKKMLSLLAATAIAAGSFAAMAVSSTAADSVTYTWDFTDSTWFNTAYNAGSDIKSKEGTETSTILSNPGAKFSLNTSSVSGFQVAKTEATVANAMQIVVPAGGSASLSIQLTTGSGGKALYIRDAQSTAVLTASNYTKNVLSTYTASLTPGATYKLDTTEYKAYIGKVTLTVSANASGDTEPTVAPETTEAPADPTEAPAEPDTLIPVNEAKTWTQADFEIGAYTETVLSSDKTLAINGTDKKAINVDKNAIKLGGTGSAAERNVSFIPAADGVVKVTAVNGNASATDRYFAISVDGTETASELINTTNSVELTVAVKANEPVYIYSKNSGVNLTEITYTAGASSATEAPETTEAPATEAPATEAPATEAPATEAPATEAPLNNLPVDTEITFDNYSGTIADGTVIDGYLRVNDAKGKAAVDGNSKTVEGTTYTTRLKSGGNSAVYTLKPAADGILRVVAVSSKAGETRDFAVNGVTASTGNDPAIYDFNIKADEEVKITFANGVNIYGIKLVTKTQSVESSAAYTTDGGYDKDVVVGVINLNTVNMINLMDATYEGRTPQSVDNATEPVYVSGPINITVIINGATSTEALEHVMFN